MTEGSDIRCPICGEFDGCKHLVASFDHENAAIADGIFFEREAEVTQLLCERFAAVDPESGWNAPPDFVELWESFVDQPDEPLDSGLVARLLDDLLRGTDAICEEDGGVVAFFDRNPASIYGKVVEKIRSVIDTTP